MMMMMMRTHLQRFRTIAYIVGFLFLILWKSHAQNDDAVADDVPISVGCDASNCLDCLNVGCGWFPLGGEDGRGECVDTCSVIADAPCYSDDSFGGSSPQLICNRVQEDEADSLLCSNITDCRTCTSTSKSDAVSMCVWYDISNTCGHGLCLSLVGCGSLSCPAEGGAPVPASSPSPAPTALDQGDETSVCERSSVSCDACLGSGCGWTRGGLCLESCNIIADVACYDNTTFVNVTDPTEICAKAAVEDSDASLCLAQTNCSTCTTVPLSIAGRSCIWYQVADDPALSSCCLACDVPGNPTTTCDSDDLPPAMAAECNINATTCAECVSNVTSTTTTTTNTCWWYEATPTTEGYCSPALLINVSNYSTTIGVSICQNATTGQNDTTIPPVGQNDTATNVTNPVGQNDTATNVTNPGNNTNVTNPGGKNATKNETEANRDSLNSSAAAHFAFRRITVVAMLLVTGFSSLVFSHFIVF